MNFERGAPLLAGLIAGAINQAVGADTNLWLWGLVGGLIHYMIAGPVVATIPSLDPATGVVGAQGFAYNNYGALDVITSFVGHMSFGPVHRALLPTAALGRVAVASGTSRRHVGYRHQRCSEAS